MSNVVPMTQEMPYQTQQNLQHRKPISDLQQNPPGLTQEDYLWQKKSTSFIDDVLIQQTKNITEELKEIKKNLLNQNNDYRIISDRIYSLPSDEWEIVKPINILIKIYPDEVIALLPDLELYSDGRNEIEAVSNLKLELLDLIDDLNELPDSELGRDPRSWKKSLNFLIKKCQ